MSLLSIVDLQHFFLCEAFALKLTSISAFDTRQEPWEVLDTATDLSVHFLVVSLTTVIYPFAPLLFLA